MIDNVKPSRLAVNTAFEMGRTLAMSDPRLVPNLDTAHQYPNYVHFMTAHRHRLQQSIVFQEWDAPLQGVIEEEARRRGLKLEDPRQWEIVESALSVPLHCAFWFGWETVHNLKAKFDRALEQYTCKQATIEAAVALSPLMSHTQRPAEPAPVGDGWIHETGPDVPRSPAIYRSASGIKEQV